MFYDLGQSHISWEKSRPLLNPMLTFVSHQSAKQFVEQITRVEITIC